METRETEIGALFVGGAAALLLLARCCRCCGSIAARRRCWRRGKAAVKRLAQRRVEDAPGARSAQSELRRTALGEQRSGVSAQR